MEYEEAREGEITLAEHFLQKTLNEFIVASDLVCKKRGVLYSIIGINRPRLLTFTELGPSVRCRFKISSPPTYLITDADLLAMLDAKPHPGSWAKRWYEPSDISEQEIAEIPKAFELCRANILHYFEFEYYAAASGGDEINSLLNAYYALEAAHSALLKIRIKLQDSPESINRVINDFLHKAGISKTLPVTVAFVMKENERPPSEVINKAIKAIETRNAIVHSKRKDGEFSIRKIKMGMINLAAFDIRDLLKYFKTAIENTQNDSNKEATYAP